MDRDVCYVTRLLSMGDVVLGGTVLLKTHTARRAKVSEPDTFKRLCMKAHMYRKNPCENAFQPLWEASEQVAFSLGHRAFGYWELLAITGVTGSYWGLLGLLGGSQNTAYRLPDGYLAS